MDGAIRVHHHFLYQVFRIVMIAAVFQRQNVETPLVIRGQRTKRFRISALGASNQIRFESRRYPHSVSYRHKREVSVGTDAFVGDRELAGARVGYFQYSDHLQSTRFTIDSSITSGAG